MVSSENGIIRPCPSCTGSKKIMDIIAHYTALIHSLDAECREQEKKHAHRLHCRPGCDACCNSLSVLPLEADILCTGFRTLTEEQQQCVKKNLHNQNNSCPLLADRLCLLYSLRPIICRTHGLAIAYINDDEEAIEVSACPINFPEGHEFFKEDLLFLDHFNDELFQLNQEFTKTTNQDPLVRISIREIILNCE